MCETFHGGFALRKLAMVPVGGDLMFAESRTKLSLGAPPPIIEGGRTLPIEPSPANPGLPQATGGAEEEADAEADADGGYGNTASSDAAALLSSPLDSARARGLGQLPPLGLAGGASTGQLMPFPMDQPPQLPPPANRIATRVPPRVDGTSRPAKVAAPTVSVNPAQANPNLMNLLLEVPYKRGVHTVSVNQRYLNHEPTFDAAFELMPARADFGPLVVGAVYRHTLKLVNVSNLSQRYSIKQNLRAKVVHTPGVVAAGMCVLLEVEVCEALPGELHEVITIVTEREEISIPVSATIHDENSPAVARGRQRPGVRLLSTSARDPALSKTVAPTVYDIHAGTKRFNAPPRNLEYTKPDFFAEPPSDDDEPAA